MKRSRKPQDQEPKLSFTHEDYDDQAEENRRYKDELARKMAARFGVETAETKDQIAKNVAYKEGLAKEMERRFGVETDRQSAAGVSYQEELREEMRPLNDEAAGEADHMRADAERYEAAQKLRWDAETIAWQAEQDARAARAKRRLQQKYLGRVIRIIRKIRES